MTDMTNAPADLAAPERVRHRKRGTEYDVIWRGLLQTDTPLSDYAEVIAYRGDDGDVWVRPVVEFEDGRFEAIANRRAHPAAPAEVEGLVERLRGISRSKLEEEIGVAFDCTRVWEAWRVGTMGPDDFVPITDRIDDLVDAAIEPFATALTALQARAERVEAVADQLADALHHMINASLHPDQFADEALAAHAKLKGGQS